MEETAIMAASEVYGYILPLHRHKRLFVTILPSLCLNPMVYVAGNYARKDGHKETKQLAHLL